MKETYRAYLLRMLFALLAIDSNTGDTLALEDFLVKEAETLGYEPVRLRKGGVTVDLGGVGRGLCLSAHGDDIGLIVRYVNPDGSIRVCMIGGLYPFQCEWANVRIHARGGKVYTGTIRRQNSSLHLMSQEDRSAHSDFEKNLFLFLDEDVTCAADVTALGIACGDMVCLDPMTTMTDSGYIKSRFLDDKASLAAILAFMRYIKEEGITLSRHVTAHFSLYEEVGHGGSSGVPGDTEDFLAVDIGCCGPTHYSSEKKVSICLMDRHSPYNRAMADELIAAAEREGVPYALDVFVPNYGSDAKAALETGLDIRHALIGPGVLGTHGYERTHIEGLMATFGLLKAYVR